jgi:hypothetical protein
MKSTVSYEESGWYDGRVFCCFEFFNSNLLWILRRIKLKIWKFSNLKL